MTKKPEAPIQIQVKSDKPIIKLSNAINVIQITDIIDNKSHI